MDPASLHPLRIWRRDGRAVDAILDLHRALLLGGRGKLPVSVLAVSTLILVLVGAVLALRRPSALSLRLWPLAETPGALLASHRNLSVLLALPMSFMAATGLAMTYPKQAQALIAQAFREQAVREQAVREHRSPRTVAAPEIGPVAWKAALTAADAAFPGLQPRAVSWPARPGGAIEVRFRQPGEWSSGGQSAATVTPMSARLIARRDAREASRATRIWSAVHPLHAGQAPPWVEAAVLLCLAASLVLSVVLALWAQVRRLKRPRKRPTASPRAAATPW